MIEQPMIEQRMPAQTNIQTMTANLIRVLVCSPRNAGWDRSDKAVAWSELGFHHPPHLPAGQSQHDALCQLLADAGAEVIHLPPSDALTLDAVYTHDASLPTNHGLILMNPGKPNRRAEARAHAAHLSRHSAPTQQSAQPGPHAPQEATVFGEITLPATTEAGDILWLDPQTLLVGHGYRTNQSGIDQTRALLAPKQVEVISAPLPYGPGPACCLHLMSLMSLLDEQTILVDLPWLAVETVELLRSRNFRLLEIDYAERDSLACNVLSLGSQRLIALEENASTNQRLSEAGFKVSTFKGSELCLNGSGGPTCLTRPLQRK